MTREEAEQAVRLALIAAAKRLTALTYQMELLTDMLKQMHIQLACITTKLQLASELELEDEDDGQSAG